MSVLKHPIVLVLCLLGLVVYLLNHLTTHSFGLLNNYFNDFLCMPIVLSLTLGCIRFIKKNESLYIGLSSMLMVTLYFSFHFEWLMPRLSERYTSDIWDIGLYFFGTWLFYTFQKKLF